MLFGVFYEYLWKTSTLCPIKRNPLLIAILRIEFHCQRFETSNRGNSNQSFCRISLIVTSGHSCKYLGRFLRGSCSVLVGSGRFLVGSCSVLVGSGYSKRGRHYGSSRKSGERKQWCCPSCEKEILAVRIKNFS